MEASLGFFELVRPGFSLSLGSAGPSQCRSALAAPPQLAGGGLSAAGWAAGVTIAHGGPPPSRPRAGPLVRPRAGGHGTRRALFDGQAPSAAAGPVDRGTARPLAGPGRTAEKTTAAQRPGRPGHWALGRVSHSPGGPGRA
jgi:hypothetical protein